MTSLAQLIATPKFDSGRGKLRLEGIQVSTDNQTNESLGSNIAVGVTMLSPLLCLFAAYLWAMIVG